MTRPNNWMAESYMNIKEDNRPYMDPYLKDMINKSFVIFERLKRGQKKVYFTGNWQKDVMSCFPGRQSAKIFKKMRTYLDDDNFSFTQKKLEKLDGYEYIVHRR